MRIAFLVAALNDFQIRAADITNAYVNAECCEKVWTVARPGFGATEKGTSHDFVYAGVELYSICMGETVRAISVHCCCIDIEGSWILLYQDGPGCMC